MTIILVLPSIAESGTGQALKDLEIGWKIKEGFVFSPYWLAPEFQVFFLKEFNRMKKEETFLLENTRKEAFEKLLRSAEEIKTVSEPGLSLGEEE